jgi:hypothetical protein
VETIIEDVAGGLNFASQLGGRSMKLLLIALVVVSLSASPAAATTVDDYVACLIGQSAVALHAQPGMASIYLGGPAWRTNSAAGQIDLIGSMALERSAGNWLGLSSFAA